MNIALVTPSPIPFVVGGAEKLFIGMLYNINKFSIHNLELIKLPCHDQEFWSLIDCYRKFSQLDLSYFDAVITTKYPAWMIKHENHILYMQHTCRGVYDLYPLTKETTDWITPLEKDNRLSNLKNILSSKPSRNIELDLFKELEYLKSIKEDLPKDIFKFPGPVTRKIIHFLDKIALSPKSNSNPYGIKEYFAISRNVAQRQDYFPECVNIKVIHHPSNLENLTTGDYKYIFTASRLEKLKRIDLLIKAFKKVKGNIEFLIAGTGGEEQYLKDLAKNDKRIKFLGFVPDEELVNLYSNALFVPFIPYDEDYGLITIEAMKSSKAVLTTTDSGGVKEIVDNLHNGMIVEPNVDSLAKAMQYLINNQEETIKMGKNAFRSVEYINWGNFIYSMFGRNSLKDVTNFKLKTPEYVKRKCQKKPKILVLSTYSIYPPVSGGKIRAFNLYKGLSKEFDVTILSIDETYSKTEFSDSFREIRIGKNFRFRLHQRLIERKTKVSSGDIACIEGYKFLPDLIQKFNELKLESEAIILIHPYLFNLVKNENLPVIYDAPDVEFNQKKGMFLNKKYLSLVRDIEKQAVEKSNLICPVSKEDATEMKNLYSIPDNKIFVVPNGIDTSKIKLLTNEDKKKLKKKLGFDENDFIAVFIGSYHKPNLEAVRYIEKFAQEIRDKNIKFIIIGGASEGVKKEMGNLIPLGILKDDEKDLIMKVADIGLNPILSGSGTNIKVLEYIAYGLPVISTPFGARGFSKSKVIVIVEIGKFIDKILDIKEFIDEYKNILKQESINFLRYYEWTNISQKYAKYLKKLLKC